MIAALIMLAIMDAKQRAAEKEAINLYEKQTRELSDLYRQKIEAEIQKFLFYSKLNAMERRVIVCSPSFFRLSNEQQLQLTNSSDTNFPTLLYSNKGSKLLPREVLIPNSDNKDVISEIEQYFSNKKGKFDNLIISGGKYKQRQHILRDAVSEVATKNIPVVYIHSNKSEFLEIMKIWPQLKILSPANCSYNPFPQKIKTPTQKNITVNALTKWIMSSMPTAYENNTTIEYAVNFVMNCLYSCSSGIDFIDLLMLDYNKIGNKINSCKNKHKITVEVADELRNQLDHTDINSLSKVCSYLQDIATQSKLITNLDVNNSVKESSLIDLMSQGKIISINLGIDNYESILSFILRDLKQNVPSNLEYLIVFDDVIIPQERKIFDNLINDRRCNFILSYEDITTIPNCGDTEIYLKRFIDKANETIIFKHATNASEILSNVLPKYQKRPITVSSTVGKGDAVGLTAALYAGFNNGINIGATLNTTISDPVQAPCVSADLLTSLADKQACIYSKDQNRIFFLEV
ncbi:MAG: hypothetical protein LBM93_03655 [Oscillospiraceae bacterium]|jgi:hypothetical protein|nr:hypothetical protein [Oscillospiraceae bacterium]